MFFMSMSDTVLNRIQHMQKVAEVWQPQQNSLTPCSVKSQFNIPEIRHIFFSTTKLRYHNAFHHKVLYKAPEDDLCQNTPDPRELLQANSLLFLARSSESGVAHMATKVSTPTRIYICCKSHPFR